MPGIDHPARAPSPPTPHRQLCGYEYTTKLHRMFNDIELSRGLSTGLRQFLSRHPQRPSFDVTVQILCRGSWPLTPPVEPFTLPDELNRATNLISEFYASKHSGRRLAWLHQYSKGDVLYHCRGQTYSLIMSTYQMAVLLRFNDADELSVDQLSRLTHLERERLCAILEGFLRANVLVLCSDGAATDADRPAASSASASDAPKTSLSDRSRVAVNCHFSSKRRKINLTIPLPAEQKSEAQKCYHAVQTDRAVQIQACIVRIMKARKTLRHTLLIKEIVEQLSQYFAPSVPDIKKAIDRLLEGEYIARSSDAKDVYTYIA